MLSARGDVSVLAGNPQSIHIAEEVLPTLACSNLYYSKLSLRNSVEIFTTVWNQVDHNG